MVGDESATVDDDEESPLEEIVAGAVIGLTFLVGFGLMFAGVPFFWVAFIVGFAGVLPMAMGFAKLYEHRQSSESPRTNEQEDALEELRKRYARGEFTDEEFERRVEHLLETESLADARAYTERPRTGRASETGTERTSGTTSHERETELESE